LADSRDRGLADVGLARASPARRQHAVHHRETSNWIDVAGNLGPTLDRSSVIFSRCLRPPAAGACDKTRARRSPRRRSMAMPGSSKMLRSFHKRPEYLQALDRVKEWTRSRFKLPEDTAIPVPEGASALPRCPPPAT